MDLIPQPHGGALRAPWQAGHQASGNRSPIRSLRRQMRALLADFGQEAISIMIERARSDDERVSTIAVQEVLKHMPPATDDGGDIGAINVSRLTPEQFAELRAAMDVIRRLRAAADGGAAEA